MKHLVGILVKFIMVTVVLELVLVSLTNLSFMSVLYVAAAVTFIAYILGDLIVLPLSNNTVATVADFGLAFATIYGFNYIFLDARISVTDALIGAFALALGEWIFHKFVADSILIERHD